MNINFEEGLFQITFFFQIGNGLLQFGIPFGSEAGDERLLEKTIDGQAELLAPFNAATADVPTVIIHSKESALEGFDAKGIEPAGDGLGHRDAAFALSLLDGAKAGALLVITSEDAVLAAYNTCNKFAVAVGVGHSLLGNDPAGFGREVCLNFGHDVFNRHDFVEGDGRSCIAFNAAGAAANAQVAGENFLEAVGRKQHVAYLNNS